MSNPNLKNPYKALKREFEELKVECRDWARQCVYPRVVNMWQYPKAKLATAWRLDDLAERVATADQLGYDVRLKVNEQGGDLMVQYIKRPTAAPWQIRP